MDWAQWCCDWEWIGRMQNRTSRRKSQLELQTATKSLPQDVFVPRPLSFLFHWKDFKAPLQLHDGTKSGVCPLHVRLAIGAERMRLSGINRLGTSLNWTYVVMLNRQEGS